MNLSYEQLVKTIVEQTSISEQELEAKVKKKLDDLAGLISKEGAAHIVANELKVDLQGAQEPLLIKDLAPGMRSVEVTVKIQNKYPPREFNTSKSSGKVANALVADQSGVARMVFWNDQVALLESYQEGDILAINKAYVRADNQGRAEIHVSESSAITKNPEGITIQTTQSSSSPAQTITKKINELNENDTNVSVIATIVQVFEPKYFSVCPECRARVKEDNNYACPTHGAVSPKYNYVMNVYLDDGTDNIRCVLWAEQTAQLLEKTDSDMIVIKEQPQVFEPFKTDLLGMIVNVTGRINKNEAFGRIELVANNVVKDVDPQGAPQPQKERTKEIIENEEHTITTQPRADPVIETKKESVQAEEELFTLEDIEDLEDLE